MGLLITAGLAAQTGNNEMHGGAKDGNAKSISFPASDIQFWTGTGTNQATYILAWDDDPSGNDTALVWGVRWNGTATATTLLDTIAAYDTRFTYTLSGSLMTDMSFNDGTINPGSSMNGWCYYHNGSWGMYAWPNQPMVNGDVIEMSSSCMFTMNSATAVTDPSPTGTTDTVDATIDTSDIVFWVGNGTNRAVLIVNWGNPDTAFAWGFRFNGTVTAQTMVDSIAAADPRFWTVGTPSYNGDIHYILNNGDTLGLIPGPSTADGYNFWWANLNGVSAGSGSGESLHNGDVFKYGDYSVGIGWDPMGTYFLERAWLKTPTPAPLPTPTDTTTVEDATIDTADILYWVGTGSNKLTFVVNWADTALAWGYRFDADSVLLSTVMDHIAEVDPRFRYTGTSMVSDINFITNGDTLGITPGNWWSHYLNGTTSAGMMQWMHNDDFSRWADPAAGVLVDSVYHDDWGGWWERIYAYPQTIHPVSEPTPVNATITADEIEYWIGEGENQLIFVVNWADTALAWGYRFADDSVMLGNVMDDIAEADPRFSYIGSGMVDDIYFVEEGDTLAITPGNWWEHLLNGYSSMGMSQWMHNGDFSRWADPAAGIAVDSFYYDGWGWVYTYVYPQRIHSVSDPITEGPFCGIVGTEGCEAINYTDNRIKAWATGCTVVRGSRNVSDPDAAPVDYGTEDAGVGPASDNTMNAVSLGDGGMATLTFEYPITNGEGYDFAVYENSFDDYFLELAFVEVSSDGETFVRFPATSLTQTHTQIGSYGQVDATFINNLAGKYRVGWGTPFDLEELRDSANLDINNITHVRIIDVVGSIDPQYGSYDAFGHLVNDPFPTVSHSGGFDLEGVCVLNQNNTGIEEVSESSMKLYPNPANNKARLTIAPQANRNEAVLYDVTGRKVVAYTVEAGATGIELNTSTLANGVYMLRLGSEVMKLIVKH